MDPFRGLNVPHTDGWANAITGLGTVARDKTVNTVYCRDNVLDPEELSAMFAHEDLARTIVMAPLDEAFRKGFRLSVEDADGKEDADASKELDELACMLTATVKEAFQWARVFGGAGVFANVKGAGLPNQPLDPTRAAAVVSLPVFDSRYLWPLGLKDDPILFSREPAQYAFANDGYSAASATAFDESRIFRVVGIPADRRMRVTLRYWGYSVLQPIYNCLRRYGTADQSALQLLMDASQFAFKLKGLIQGIESGNMSVIQQRMALVDMQRGIGKAVLLDAEGDEGITRSSAPLSGLSDVLAYFGSRLSAATAATGCRIPVSILFGVGPAGLNTTGDLDMEVWHSSVAAYQTHDLEPFIKRLLPLYAKEWGFDPETVCIKWHPLSEPNAGDVADVRLKVAQMDQIYFNLGMRYEEILLSRFGTGDWSMDTTVDVDELEASRAVPTPDPMEQKAQEADIQATAALKAKGMAPDAPPAADPPPDPKKDEAEPILPPELTFAERNAAYLADLKDYRDLGLEPPEDLKGKHGLT